MAVKKSYAKSGKTCRATFEYPDVSAERVFLCGDFNAWSPQDLPLARRKDGRFSVTVTLESGRSYRYRYVLDGDRWENDWEADSYIANEFGGEDSLVEV